MDSHGVTASSILEAIANALQHTADVVDDAVTTKELMEITGWSQLKVQKAIDAAWKDGKIERVYVKRKFASRCAKVPAYRLVVKPLDP